MSQTILTISGAAFTSNYPDGNQLFLNGTWTGTQLGSSAYTLMTSVASNGDAIKKLVQGYGQTSIVGIDYNDPANMGGQTTPSTAWLSPAQDDSWAPNYQVAGSYQTTTQVPTQQAPYMTHVYMVPAAGFVGATLNKIHYVIDDNNFVVYDPMGVARLTEVTVSYFCENYNPATSATLVVASGDSVYICTEDGYSTGVPVAGPLTVNFTANQFGIVTPFLVAPDTIAGSATTLIINR
jgi:hypothetical protein